MKLAMIDCPDCGKQFSGRRCKCGYEVNSAGRERPQIVIPCAHSGCQEPAMTRDALGANICKTHWMHAHRLENAAWLRERNIKPGKESARYQLSKLAYEIANNMQKPMNREWAFRIIEKANVGQVIPMIALQMARSVASAKKEAE